MLEHHNQLLAYNPFICLHLSYCLAVWSNSTMTVVNDLNRTLNRCLQTVSGSRASTLTQLYYFDSFNICDFKTQVLISNVLKIFHQLQLTILIIIEFYNPYLLSSSYSTRAATSSKVFITSKKRTAVRYCFSKAAPYQWHSLPNDITVISIVLVALKLNYALLSVVDSFNCYFNLILSNILL